MNFKSQLNVFRSNLFIYIQYRINNGIAEGEDSYKKKIKIKTGFFGGDFQ